MTLGGAILEMHRRHRCTQCQIDRTFTPAQPDLVAV